MQPNHPRSRRTFPLLGLLTSLILLAPSLMILHAQEAVTLDNASTPAPNTPDEPLADDLSLEKAAEFLDLASLSWQKERKCGTCHTNYAYMMARPALKSVSAEQHAVRQFFEEMVTQTWPEKGPRFDAEPVCAATALAFHDSVTTGSLHETTKQALTRMWSLQREDGGWDWLKCNWPPMESDDHYGVTLAALAVGVAPDNYKNTEEAKAGMAKIRKYLEAHPAETLHQRAMLLWASLSFADLLSPEDQQSTLKDLLELQREDGGWAIATLGNWERSDGTPQDTTNSDGYGTGFVIYLARAMGVASSDSRIQRGIHWIKSHQRQSGRWFTRSLNKDSRHYISHTGTAFAIMALKACGEIPDSIAVSP